MKLHIMQNTKNSSPFLLSILALSSMCLLFLIPFDPILSNMSLSDFEMEYIELTIKMAIVFFVSRYFITKLKIKKIVGLSSLYSWRFKSLNLIPIYLVILGITSIIPKDLSQIHIGNVLLLLLACLCVGFAEEFLFRGVIQSYFLRTYAKRKKGVFIGVFIPALVFGLFHLVNLIKNDNTSAVLIQVVFATFIGFFFGVLVLKTNKIIPLAITHGLINFSFSLAFLPGLETIEDAEVAISMAPIIVTLPLFIIGLIVLRTIDKEVVGQKLSQSFN